MFHTAIYNVQCLVNVNKNRSRLDKTSLGKLASVNGTAIEVEKDVDRRGL